MSLLFSLKLKYKVTWTEKHMLFIAHERWVFHVWEAALPFTFFLLPDSGNICSKSPSEVKGYADVYQALIGLLFFLLSSKYSQ